VDLKQDVDASKVAQAITTAPSILTGCCGFSSVTRSSCCDNILISRPVPSLSFPVHYTLASDMYYSELLTASLSEARRRWKRRRVDWTLLGQKSEASENFITSWVTISFSWRTLTEQAAGWNLDRDTSCTDRRLPWVSSVPSVPQSGHGRFFLNPCSSSQFIRHINVRCCVVLQ
jgi:hypothetical protein